ncbi:MAG TPA: DoxX family protein [Candidatus Baltobacteraceae bacterium]|jgi:thiosulfate dehydrogenase [quinone] large subunit|nr:DoxX family protein [Candidatus Baltobacteraceae bacterium]
MRRLHSYLPAAVRIYLGLVWFTYGESKIDPSWAGGKQYFLSAVRDSESSTGEPFRSFLAHVVVPHQQIFAELIAYGETLVGIALIAGLLIRPASLAGMFLALNYYFMTGKYLSHFGVESLELMLFVLCAIVLTTKEASVASLDNVIKRRRSTRGS